MRVGRAGVISHAVRMGRTKKTRSEHSHDVEVASQHNESVDADEIVDIKDINIQEKTGERIVFRKLPIFIWIVGVVIAVIGLYFLYHLAFAKIAPDYKEFNEGYWWQYLILACIFLLSIVFITAGRIETVVFDKDSDEFARYKVNIWWMKSGVFQKLSNISEIRVSKRGHQTVFSDTVYYKIVVDFKDGESVTILDSKKEEKVVLQVLYIKNFLGMKDSSNGNRVHQKDLKILKN